MLEAGVFVFSGIIVLFGGISIVVVRGLVVMKRSHSWTISSVFTGLVFYGVCSSMIEDNNFEYFFVCVILGVGSIGFGIMAFLNFRKEKKVKRLQQ